ncbi:MAG: hypothetical protein EP344_15930 [Bacteroidetes bacterium]|nr:MAG: hypothetical protein EP344_15930 [Bacteroidota bacterium]
MKTTSILRAMGLQFEPALEEEFLHQYYLDSIVTVRSGIILGIVLYSLFGILDEYMLPVTKQLAWAIRFIIIVPLLLGLLAYTFTASFSKIFNSAIFLTSLMLGYGIVFMIYYSHETEPGYNFYYTGLMLVIVWVGTFSQLRFVYAAWSILVIIIGYLAVSVLKQHMVSDGLANPKFPIFINNSFFFISSAILAFFSSYSFEKTRRNSFMHQKTIEREKKKSDRLLLNILPESVADDLKLNGKTIPREFDNVTVFFSDIVDFTKLSTNLEPAELINILNELFTAFDNIMEKYDCERIKTIGDAYLAVCGMPKADQNHACNIAQAAVEIVRYCKARNRTHTVKLNIRIGIHTGKVVGGVVGVKKYIYDIFGSTINIASRMETHSEPMRINISEASYLLLKDTFPCTRRDTILVKGVGEMHMYFLNQMV